MILPAISSSSPAITVRIPCRLTIGFLSRRKKMAVSQFSSSSPSTLISCSSASTTTSTTTATDGKPKPWLFVGLGNPGKLYNGTRHNVGFELVDAIAEAEGISMSSVSFKALSGKGILQTLLGFLGVSFKAQFGEGHIGDVPVMLAKPQTFMNLSGQSVGSIVSYYKIPLKQVVVIFDDMDLPFGALRLLPKGGHGGHNGMRSVIDHFKGSRDFPRLRIGIGRPTGKMDGASFVLRPFNKQEREELDFTFQNGYDALRILLLEGFDKSATFTNSASKSESKSMKQLG
ncbi:hypothetical protein C5167_022931 [Papaver somniferum]|uniref:peptidyl-tRNA hydrolase n=1 Tax=Papaver somniferum TaxID=3469 RepID=A0A4Y7JN61_PAPSO|nr:peptidyl-tRNA hydrolase, mitochondrial-like isoform X1 [Papaver somniferum]RZC61169.1 hypothetical protein C5167_022931 [Papaver somniferum]